VQKALEAAMAELVLGPDVAEDAVAQFLARHDFSEADRRALRDEFERLRVYRTLVRGTLRDAVKLAIPRTLARLGALFDEYFERFLAERGPRTHYLRDVTSELIDFCASLWATDARVPPWALDLARHEALQIVVASLKEPLVPRELAELDLARGLCFVEAARVARYAFAVHRLPSDEGDRTPPERVPTALFVYRDPEHDVRYLELSPLAASLLERLLAGVPLGDAVLASSAENGSEPAGALDGIARLLADLSARGALLGAAVPDPAGGEGNLPRDRENSTMAGRGKEPHERS
jgi:hypothetical protein